LVLESGGSENSPFEADRYWIGVDFMVIKIKEKYFYFYKRKGYKYEDKLSSKEIQQPFPDKGTRNAYWYFLTHTKNNPQAHGITIVAFHPEIFGVSYFPQGTKVLF
jgi:hypothetical protein